MRHSIPVINAACEPRPAAVISEAGPSKQLKAGEWNKIEMVKPAPHGTNNGTEPPRIVMV